MNKNIKEKENKKKLDEIAALLTELFKKEDEFFAKNKKNIKTNSAPSKDK